MRETPDVTLSLTIAPSSRIRSMLMLKGRCPIFAPCSPMNRRSRRRRTSKTSLRSARSGSRSTRMRGPGTIGLTLSHSFLAHQMLLLLSLRSSAPALTRPGQPQAHAPLLVVRLYAFFVSQRCSHDIMNQASPSLDPRLNRSLHSSRRDLQLHRDSHNLPPTYHLEGHPSERARPRIRRPVPISNRARHLPPRRPLRMRRNARTHGSVHSRHYLSWASTSRRRILRS